MAPLRAIVSFLLASVAVASPTTLKTRQELVTADTIIGDVYGIDAGVQSLRGHVAAYDGSLLAAAPLAGDFTAITVANRKGVVDSELRVDPYTAEDSTRIVQSVIDTVGNSIPAAVSETVAKKQLFEEGGQGPLILGTLQTFLYLHDSFSATVAQDLSADQVRAAAVVAKIHNAIQGGKSVVGCTGVCRGHLLTTADQVSMLSAHRTRLNRSRLRTTHCCVKTYKSRGFRRSI